MNLLSLDYGDKYVGLAIRRQGSMPFGLATIENKGFVGDDWWDKIADELQKIIVKENITKLIIGLPKTLGGTDSPQTKKVQDFVSYVKIKLEFPIFIVDERFTSVEAERKHVANPHQEAGRLILENYLQIKTMKEERKIHLSVVIPAYNEEKRIVETLRQTDAYLAKQDYTSEIVVISDGSTDKTVDVVENLDIPRLRVINNKVNHGKGYVVRQAMQAVNGQYRLFMDADNSTKIKEIEKFWPEIKKGNSVVIGSRHMAGSDIRVEQPWYRRLLGRMGNILTQMILLWGIEDTQAGFKLFTKEAAEEIFKRQTIEGWGFDMEVLLIAKKHGFKIQDVPVNWYNEGESKFRSLSGYLSTLLELFKIRFNSWIGKYK